MKSMALQAKMEGKNVTKHSARKTLVKNLKTAIQPRSAITGVTGFKSAFSCRLQRRRLIINVSEVPSSTTHGINLECVGVHLLWQTRLRGSEARIVTVNHFYGCQVTINY